MGSREAPTEGAPTSKSTNMTTVFNQDCMVDLKEKGQPQKKVTS